MKTKVCVFSLGAFLFLAMAIPQVQASTFLGQTTWTVTITETSNDTPPGTTFTITGSISMVGGAYYLFQGYVSPQDDLPYVVSGSGVLINDNLILTLSSSQDHSDNDWSDTGIMRCTINKSNFNGTFYEIQTDLDRAATPKTISHGYTIGTLTCTGGVLPLQ